MRVALRPALLLFVGLAAFAASVRLYLKDGSYHVVREYEVHTDRVRFYSVERSDWEEIPLELVDLNRTEREANERRAARAEESAVLAVEEEAERAQRNEVARLPLEPGVHLIDGEQLRPIPQAVVKAVTSRGRSVLQVLVPVPLVAGRTTVELDGERSANLVTQPQPEFYFRMALPERFAILRLGVKKGARVAQTWHLIPKSEELIEEQEIVPVLHRQLGPNLYKIWPVEPLKPGEYAVAEYTAGQRNIQVWDFAFRPAAR